MLYGILADAAVAVHLMFILFVLLGGLPALRWPRLAWVHLPVLAWGIGIELIGWVCPLTYLENYFRRLGRAEGYAAGFVEHYLLPLIYPDLLFPGGFPRSGFIAIGIIIAVLNAIIYWFVWKRHRQRGLKAGPED